MGWSSKFSSAAVTSWSIGDFSNILTSRIFSKSCGDAQEVIPGGEMSDAMIRREPIDPMLEMAEWNKTQQLRENRLAAIHGFASYAAK